MDFQTPEDVALYMAMMIPVDRNQTILEPTPGMGNLVKAVEGRGIIITPDDFWQMKKRRFDYAIMNPPFTPMAEGWRYLQAVMEMSSNVIALIPWLLLLNSERRMKFVMGFGLISITYLPRRVFSGSRVQCCILRLNEDYKDQTTFLNYAK
jgi:type I restriction-modification system DNA methylase subunit